MYNKKIFYLLFIILSIILLLYIATKNNFGKNMKPLLFDEVYLLFIIIAIILFLYIRTNNIDKFDQTLFNRLDLNIPNTIYLTYKTREIPDYIIALWKKINPEYNIKLYDNNDCIDFLQKEFGQKHVDIFNYIKDGPIKSDFWRVCVLYINGGVYCDIDIEPLVPIRYFLEKDVKFLSCISITKNLLNPHIIITYAKNPILKQCIDKYVEYYDNKKPYAYWKWSIVHIMTDVVYRELNEYINIDGIYTDTNGFKYQFLKEMGSLTTPLSKIYCKYKNKKILNNRHSNYDANNHSFAIKKQKTTIIYKLFLLYNKLFK